jgi:hypothetical protein
VIRSLSEGHRIGITAIAAALAYLLAARLGLGFDGLSGQDGHEYARYAGAIADWLSGGAHPGWHYWAIGYTLTGALLSKLSGDVVLALHIVSALALAGAAVATARIAQLLWPDTGAFPARLAAGMVLILPAAALAGVLVMSDMLATAFACAAVWAWLEMRRAARVAPFLWFVTAATAAVWTRYGCFVLLAIPACDVLRIALKSFPWRTIGLALLVTLPFLITHLTIKQADSVELFGQYVLQEWSPLNWFARDFVTADGASHFALIYLASFPARLVWWPLLVLLPFVRSGDYSGTECRIILAMIGAYLLFVAGIPFQNARFQLPVAPLLTVLLVPAAMRLWSLAKHNWLRGLIVLLLIAISLFQQVRLLTPHAERNLLERAIAARLATYPAATPLYVFTFDPALRNRQVRQPMLNLWTTRYADFQQNSLVLFAPERHAKQWQGKNPMLNWGQLTATKRLSVEADFGNGWRLYRVLGSK